MSFSPQELQKLRTALLAVEKKIFDSCCQTTTTTTMAIHALSSRRAPVWTGNLRSSDEYHVETGGMDVYGYVWFGGNGDPINPRNKARASSYMWKPGDNPANHDGKYLIESYNAFAKNFHLMIAEGIRRAL